MVLMTAGNLSISQSIRELLSDYQDANGNTIWNVQSMYDAARILGEAVRVVHQRDAKALSEFGIDFNVSLIFGGQIKVNVAACFRFILPAILLKRTTKTPTFRSVKPNTVSLFLTASSTPQPALTMPQNVR
jgi:predicted proteasome-type protease